MKELIKNVKEKLVSKYLKNTPKNYFNKARKFKPRIKARIRKNKQIIGKNIGNFFDWIKGAELVELKKCNISEDPVRPELSNEFRTSDGRKIFGVKYQGEIHAVMCFAYTNEIPKSVEDLEKMSHDAYLQSTLRGQNIGKIAIAYTVWSKKKGGGKLIVKEVYKKEDSDLLWDKWFFKYNRMKIANKENVWNARPSGLCKRHCVVVECVHNGNN